MDKNVNHLSENKSWRNNKITKAISANNQYLMMSHYTQYNNGVVTKLMTMWTHKTASLNSLTNQPDRVEIYKTVLRRGKNCKVQCSLFSGMAM